MSNKKTTAANEAAENKAPTGAAENTTTVKEPDRKSYTPKQFDLNQVVTVRNGFQGELVYRSPKTGEGFVWDSFGAEQDMEISELRAARNSHKRYFENNWFLFDDPEVVDYLGLRQYYKNALSVENFDDVFKLSPNALREKLAKLSVGQRKSVAYRAKQLIKENEIDSIKTIVTLEECLGVELIER